MQRVALGMLLVSGSTSMLIGCGSRDSNAPQLYAVSGTVTFSGEPLLDADMVIRTTDGKHVAGSKIRDGNFTVKAAAGPSVVEITALQDVPGAEYREENPGERVPVREQYIPEKYNAKSTLKMEVKSNTKDVKFDLNP